MAYEYVHKVQYYETDKMGITHHSNYIRMMEEARITFQASIGWDYRTLEEMGVISPVVSVDGQYKATTTFEDLVTVKVKVAEFKGVVLKFDYEMTKEDGTVAFVGHSEHCFLDENGKPIRVNKKYPEFYQAVIDTMDKE